MKILVSAVVGLTIVACSGSPITLGSQTDGGTGPGLDAETDSGYDAGVCYWEVPASANQKTDAGLGCASGEQDLAEGNIPGCTDSEYTVYCVCSLDAGTDYSCDAPPTPNQALGCTALATPTPIDTAVYCCPLICGVAPADAGADIDAGPPSQAKSALVANPVTVVADGRSSSTLTLTLRNSTGDPVPGDAVEIIATGTSSLLAPTSGVTDSAGIFVAYLASSEAGTVTATATVATLTLSASVVFTAAACTLSAAGLFTVEPAVGYADQTQAIVAADFNNDGNLDLAFANPGENLVVIALGEGDGGFSTTVITVTVGASPQSITTGDFNGDQNLDLVAANGADTVTVLLGDGTGQFTSNAAITVGSSPASVISGDFNGDGQVDLAVANSGDNTVSILLGDGLGGLSSASGSPVAVGGTPDALASGDFNGDGHLDLVVTNSGDGTVSVLLGTGSGGFSNAAGSPISVGATPDALATGDFNGDGRLDVAVSNYGNATVTVLLGNGSGGFTSPPDSPLGVTAGQVSIVTGDFNGDGNLDLATGGLLALTGVTVLLGDGNAGFSLAPGSPIEVGQSIGTRGGGLATGDFIRNGRLDMAMTSGSGAILLLNQCQ